MYSSSFSFSGNLNLEKSGDKGKKLGVIIGASVGAFVLLIATIISCIVMCKSKKNNKLGKTSGMLYFFKYTGFIVYLDFE